MEEQKEVRSLLAKSLEAHMNWIIPKIGNRVNQLEAKVAGETIQQFINVGVINPKEMSHPDFWTQYGGNVKDTYSEIYKNIKERFVDGWGSEYTIQKIL
jgi:hypothetical protein